MNAIIDAEKGAWCVESSSSFLDDVTDVVVISPVVLARNPKVFHRITPKVLSRERLYRSESEF